MRQVAVTDLEALARGLLAQGQAPVLLDVREPWEIALARFSLPGVTSVAIPMGEVPARMSELDPEQPILALCHHGMRSLQVALFLQRQGYPHTYNVAGGIHAWSTQVDATVPVY